MKDDKKKEWVTPQIKIITEFDVHENVVARSEKPLDLNGPPPQDLG